MKKVCGNIWDYWGSHVICVTTNGIVTKGGRLVMGGGIAAAAVVACENTYGITIDLILGKLVKKSGNVPFYLPEYKIISFPTKEHYKDPSPMWLVEESAKKIVEIANANGLEHIATVPPGCGLGGLSRKAVYPMLEKIFDDRFLIVDNENE